MHMQIYCNDIYDLTDRNTELYKEHQKLYNAYKAASIGDLIDIQQDMLDNYKKTIDNSTEEIANLKSEIVFMKEAIKSGAKLHQLVAGLLADPE